MTVISEIHDLVDQICGDDPKRALAAYRRLTDEHLPWLERRAVLQARRNGSSWAAIGRVLGRSRQSVHRRFERVFTPDELTPRAGLVAPEVAEHRRVTAMVAELARERWIDAAGDDGALTAW